VRNPETVLENLKSHSTKPDYQYERLYRNLYNPELYILAHQQTYAKPGNMSPGVDGKTFDDMNMKRIHRIISSLKDHSYQPKPARRTYIPKKNGKMRPLGIPSGDDKLIQQAMKMILENIYENTFSDLSHGFRPGKSCHTALSQLKINFTGVKWFIEGDIKDYFNSVDHHLLINILRRRIKDEYFIGLIWKFLRAGYMENNVLQISKKGLHQGSLISPILANIYLNEFDRYMEAYKESFDNGAKRKRATNYTHIQNKEQRLRRSIAVLPIGSTERKDKFKALKILRNKRTLIPCSEPMDKTFKRLLYIRYADDFIIGIIGSKEDTQNIKSDVNDYLLSRLQLELSADKTLITHGKDKAAFLGFHVTIGKKGTPSKDKLGKLSDKHHGGVKLYVPQEAWLKKLLQSGSLRIVNRVNTKEKWKSTARTNLLYLPDHVIVRIYNWEIEGLYQYYKIADNVSVLNNYYFIMKYSMAKTLAGKHRCSMPKIMCKYNINGRFQVPYLLKGHTKFVYLYDNGFKKQPILFNKSAKKHPSELSKRFAMHLCEWCDCSHPEVTIHQVRKVSELTNNTAWERKMIAMNRKTLILCPSCHEKLHNGSLS
jgi:group II intron reverse transcriptase/maturase